LHTWTLPWSRQKGGHAVGPTRKGKGAKVMMVADIMKATISCDHRVADGAESAVLLGEIRRNMENQALLMM